ncbi:hypothetical protein HRbin24_01736 [bacterium HR24]|nr:hypothetical protein HRbin24_01736 [bacterium HR24]
MLHEAHGLQEVEPLVPAEGVLVLQVAQGSQDVQVDSQLLQLPHQLRVAHFVREQVLELAAHLRRQAVQQALHGRHLLLHLLDELVQGLGRVGAQEVAVLLQERLVIGLAAGHLLGQHPVQVADHVLQPLELLGRQAGDVVVQVLEEGVQHGLAQHLHELLELGGGLGVHELVFLQALDAAAQVLGQVLQVVLLALGDVLEHLGHVAGVVALLLACLLLAQGLLEGLERAWLPLELALRLLQAAAQGILLQVEHLLHPFLQVFEQGAEVVAVEHLAPVLAQALQEVAQPLHALAHGPPHAPLQQVAKGVLQVAEVHQVVGDGREELVRVEGRNLLRPVPLRVTVKPRHAIHPFAPRPRYRRRRNASEWRWPGTPRSR